MRTNDLVIQSEQLLQAARNDEAAALKAVQEAKQEQDDLALPEARDMDSQARYQNDYEGLQRRIDAALKTLQEARRYSDLTYQQLMQAKKHN